MPDRTPVSPLLYRAAQIFGRARFVESVERFRESDPATFDPAVFAPICARCPLCRQTVEFALEHFERRAAAPRSNLEPADQLRLAPAPQVQAAGAIGRLDYYCPGCASAIAVDYQVQSNGRDRELNLLNVQVLPTTRELWEKTEREILDVLWQAASDIRGRNAFAASVRGALEEYTTGNRRALNGLEKALADLPEVQTEWLDALARLPR